MERLPDASHLVAWLRAAAIVDVARSRPRVTKREFEEAIALREILALVGFARAAANRANRREIDALNTFARTHPPSAIELDADGSRVRHLGPHLVRGALGTIARDGIETFATRADRLVVCALASCGALLLSSAHGPKRRWCAVTTCANAANVAAFRARRAGGV